MSRTLEFKCSPISGGTCSGPALVSDEAVCFYLVEPETGVVVEKGHVLEGRTMGGTVLVAHSGKGSSVVQMDGLFKISRKGKAPVGVVLRNPDPVFVSALLIMEIPSVYAADEAFFDAVADGRQVEIDADAGILRVSVD
jgi:predicted aconitase with swiveling domain